MRQLVRLDGRVRPNRVKDLISDRTPEDVRRALGAVRRTRPTDVMAFFRRALGVRVALEAAREREGVPPLSQIAEEPY